VANTLFYNITEFNERRKRFYSTDPTTLVLNQLIVVNRDIFFLKTFKLSVRNIKKICNIIPLSEKERMTDREKIKIDQTIKKLIWKRENFYGENTQRERT